MDFKLNSIGPLQIYLFIFIITLECKEHHLLNQMFLELLIILV